MRLVTFNLLGEMTDRPGVLAGNAVSDISAHFPSVLAVVEAGEQALDDIRALGALARIPLDRVRLRSPIPRPRRNVFCVGRNYVDHVAEGDRQRGTAVKLPEVPQFFTKAPSTIIGPADPIPLHSRITTKLDYEVELAVVIGRAGVSISVDAAWDYVFGFTIANDITARDLQRRHEQWFKGKSLDGSLPLGPSLVTRDEIADPAVLTLTLAINGEERQRAEVNQMIFDIPTIIAELSAGMALEPGDIIMTGTPSGVGYAMEPPRFLAAGDEVHSVITGLGELRNIIAD